MEPAANMLTRGQLARQAGVNLATVRYYERRGLLSDRGKSSGGYHQYDQESVHRVRCIKRAQELGFTLNEIEELLDLSLDSSAVCDDVRRRTEGKITDMQQRIRDLNRMKKALAILVEQCDREGAGDHCPILESLEEQG